MFLPPERIHYLLEAYTTKTFTPEEEAELMNWVDDESEENSELRNYMRQVWEQHIPGHTFKDVDWNQMFNNVIKSGEASNVVSLTSRKRNLFLSRVSAAAIVILLAAGLYFIFTKPEPQKEPVAHKDLQPDIKAPQASRAIITFSDGRKVYLDSLKNGAVAMQGNMTVVKLDDGKIAYKGSGAGIIYNELFNPKGSKVIDLTLSDGSRVWLNAGSSIRYPVAFVEKNRIVSITGEAYFEVMHNVSKPFKVIANKVEVSVLGTHFNVNSYADERDVRVTLLTGSVSVNMPGSTKMLKPGEQAGITDRIDVTSNIDIDEVMAWKNEKFIFSEKTDIETLMRQVSRWYDVDIEYKGKISTHFGGSISRQVNITGVLKILEATGQVKCSIEANKVIVTPSLKQEAN